MTTTTQILTAADVRWAVEQAARAPSIHNTQPWRFRWDGSGFDLVADTERSLGVADPSGRELVISCGAALFNLRLALRKLDCVGQVRPLPDRRDPRLLARIDVRRDSPASVAERLAFAGMTRRHTHRGPFEERPISIDLAVALQRAGDDEGALLLYVSDPGQRSRILTLCRTAEERLSHNDRSREEIAAWTPPAGSSRRDGIPPTHYPRQVEPAADDLAARDLDLGRQLGQLPAATQPGGALAVLATPGDTEADWLIAGQALEHVLVRAAEHDVAAALHSQVTEIGRLRAEVRRELVTAAHPQILVRFGYAPPVSPTPRRQVAEVLDLTTRG